jgi:hypothetical protein
MEQDVREFNREWLPNRTPCESSVKHGLAREAEWRNQMKPWFFCHEGNHGMIGILSGSRALESRAEEGKANRQ